MAVRACEERSPRGGQEVERNEGTAWCTLPSSLQADLPLRLRLVRQVGRPRVHRLVRL